MDQLIQFLTTYNKSKITILQLMNQCPRLSYENFAQSILRLEDQQLLTAIKAAGTNGKEPELANEYKINKKFVRQELHRRVKALKKTLHPAIWVEYYLTKNLDELEQDLVVLEQLNAYLKQQGFPTTKALAQERSFEICKDEKWITEKGGQQFLEKVKVWDLLEIWPITDPVSFAINPMRLHDETPKVLIVENKATFYSLLPTLKNSSFTALVYGQGKAIVGTIQVLPEQLPLNYEKAEIYYFGDLDAEGISIWYSLSQKYDVSLALPFYKACLEKEAAKGKAYQRKNDEAINAFLRYFSQDEANKIVKALQNGLYYPQEILNAEELQHIWRNECWM
ncbi:Wadjet anti-phage system protein JetD domain-containing protein [Ureibacillus thermosphaericus]|uniref:Wadjet anti-phage system protein JetD domain-containing protein n=1 Tax=Ureibacillus thermosphaericus TaxID=51173 RepID=UPI000BBBC474|nr:Wadjet anti-phage system protein JetD domain-containing protein [Ureibacillus thermosphaericus]